MFEEGLYALVSQDPGVKAQLGGSPFARADQQSGVFAVTMPEGATQPAIVYLGIASQSVGSVQGTNRLGMKRMQFDCYGVSCHDANYTKKAVKNCLLGFTGTLIDGSAITGVLLNLEMDAFEDGPLLYRAILDFNIWYTEA